MITINARNVNVALPIAIHDLIYNGGQQRPSRNGPVIAYPGPVGITYQRPTERVLFSPRRRANPVFHLVESLWMLAGRNDVKFPATFVRNMKNFSDDGKTFWGAYGHRWREFFGWDQINAAIRELRVNPDSRRVVVSMWNAMETNELNPMPDFQRATDGGLDVPCNTHIYFDTRDGKLNMTVCNRSNDVIWGCFGANVVHMSMLQEYMAFGIGVPVGRYTQMANNLHIYTEKFPVEELKAIAEDCHRTDYYSRGMNPLPMLKSGESIEILDKDIHDFFKSFDEYGVKGVLNYAFRTEFFHHTVAPMVQTWMYRMTPVHAHEYADNILAPDWREAMKGWIGRLIEEKQK